eukprot:279576-Pyramimonas_sp.AAC.1
MALILAIRFSRGFTIFVTDNESVSAGWYSKRFLDSKGENQDLWHELGQLAERRDFSEVVVLQVPSHIPAAQAVSGPHPLWLVLGNTAADELAGTAAKENRVPASVRSRIAQVEHKAILVRKRLLRPTLDAMVAEKTVPS